MFKHYHASPACRRALLAVSIAAVVSFAGAQPSLGATPREPFADPLDIGAVMHESVAGRPLMSVARAGQRFIAVGMRGLIVTSDDGGKTWTQVQSPVRSDLLAVAFPVPREGWAAGHDGVILHTADGGRTWEKQFDGRVAATALIRDYKVRIDAGDATLQPYLDQLTLNYEAGPSLPLLGVWFKDTQHGLAVGPFGMAVATEDGGRTWVPALERIDNPRFLHLQGVSEVGGEVFIAAEKGTVFRLDKAAGKFRAVETGYAGSLFGVTGNEQVLVAYGLKGTLYRSTDRGVSWARIDSPLHGLVTSGVYIAQRQTFVFVTASGEIALADQNAGAFRTLKAGRTVTTTGVQASSGQDVVLSGLEGMRTAALQ